MEPIFKPKNLIYVLLFGNLIPYLIWVFVTLSFSEPLITVFTSEIGRMTYVVCNIFILITGLPFIYIDKED